MSTDEEWTERFIEVIESKPPIYNKSMKAHFDKKLIKQLWNEVYVEMVENWDDLPTSAKATKGNEIQLRWRNLRSCFRRELKKQKLGISGLSANKRRPYIYYDHLAFLLPTFDDEDVSSNLKEEEEEYETDPLHVEKEDSSQRIGTHSKRKRAKSHFYEDNLATTTKADKKTEDIDEDKMFLLSLVPSFKRMSDYQKLQTRIEFLTVIRNVLDG